MDIVVQRGKVVSLESLPPYSIALDGFVKGPQVDNENHRYSLDHHEGCWRYATLSACMQAQTAIRLGLNADDDLDKYTIYANDVDADVCVAVWCLKNPDKCKDALAIKLVNAVGEADMHGGAIGMNGMSKTVEWICAPETDSKRNKDYEKLSDEGLKAIMEAILHRIDLYVDGEASIEVAKQPKHGEYKMLRSENDWVMVESQDPHVFGQLYQAGFHRIVIVRPLEDGSTAVTIAKRSDFIGRFPVPKIITELQKLEPGWGGGSTIGGAPRNADGSRSHLPIDVITKTIDRVIEEETARLKKC